MRFSFALTAALLLTATLTSTAHAGRVLVYKIGGADVAADNIWKTVLNQNFNVTANTAGTVIVTIPFTNHSCTGNSATCSPSKMAVGQVRVSLRDSTGYLHDQETVWVENSVIMNPSGGVTSLMVRNSGPYTLHLSGVDMNTGTYTLTVEMMAVGGAQYRPLRHNGVKATVSLF